MSALTDKQKEATKILTKLIEDGYSFTIINDNYSFTIINDNHLIACKNENFKEDNGSNPNLVCTFAELIEAARRNYKTADLSTISETE